jgi:hypothetical protein
MALKLFRWYNRYFFGKNRIFLLDLEDDIQNRWEDNVKVRKFSKLVLKSSNFVPKIKLDQFFIYKPILHFY